MIALDLFAGSGWGVACQRLGIKEFGVEIMPEAIATREAAGMATVFTDVWDGLKDNGLVPDHDILIASPPCQTFSAAGSGSGRRALGEVLELIERKSHHKLGTQLKQDAAALGMDDRTALVLAPLAYVYRHMPSYIALEQVPSVLPVWEAYAKELHGWGYSVATGLLNAEQYGMVWACPLHTAQSADLGLDPAIVPANARASATTRFDSEWTHHARSAVASWVRGTCRDAASVATCLEQGSQGATWVASGPITPTGEVDELWMREATSGFGLTAGIAESTAWLWSRWLVENSLKKKWSTTSTSRRTIIHRAILSCIAATLITGFVTGQATRAEDCGLCLDTAVPQTRKRAFLIAMLDGGLTDLKLPTPTHSKYHPRSPQKLDAGVLPWVSMAEALGRDGFTAEKRMGAGMVERHGSRPGREAGQPAFTVRANAGGMEPGGFVLRSNYGTGGDSANRGERESMQPAPTITSKAGRMKWMFAGAGSTAVTTSGQRQRPQGEPASTILGQGSAAWTDPTTGAHIDRLTPEECAVLQTFPADFPFQGTKTKKHLQIGNAVPPLLAEVVLRHLIDL